MSLKKKMSPKKVKRTPRKKLKFHLKINTIIQRVIMGEKSIDISEFDIENEDD